jgi:hypothetical protein
MFESAALSLDQFSKGHFCETVSAIFLIRKAAEKLT